MWAQPTATIRLYQVGDYIRLHHFPVTRVVAIDYSKNSITLDPSPFNQTEPWWNRPTFQVTDEAFMARLAWRNGLTRGMA